MANVSKVLPLFVAGKLETIEQALQEGGYLYNLEGVGYAYEKDGGRFGYIDLNHEIHWIVGDNKQTVQNVDSLPASGDSEVLYVLNKTVYIWDEGTETYLPTYHDVSDQLTALTNVVQTISETVTNLVTEVEMRPTYDDVNSAITTAISPISEDISTINDSVNVIQNNVSTLQTSIDDLSDTMGTIEDDDGNPIDVPTYVDEAVSKALMLRLI